MVNGECNTHQCWSGGTYLFTRLSQAATGWETFFYIEWAKKGKILGRNSKKIYDLLTISTIYGSKDLTISIVSESKSDSTQELQYICNLCKTELKWGENVLCGRYVPGIKNAHVYSNLTF